MSYVSFLASTALFLAAAPILLAIRAARPKRMPWWLLGVLAASLGWVLSNLAVFFYYEHLDVLLAQYGGINGAPQELVDRWQNDGAKRVFALFLGWLYGLAYLCPWLAIYSAYHVVRRAGARRETAA